jgi:hypothetical protein
MRQRAKLTAASHRVGSPGRRCPVPRERCEDRKLAEILNEVLARTALTGDS